jgi:hypothetical protein
VLQRLRARTCGLRSRIVASSPSTSWCACHSHIGPSVIITALAAITAGDRPAMSVVAHPDAAEPRHAAAASACATAALERQRQPTNVARRADAPLHRRDGDNAAERAIGGRYTTDGTAPRSRTGCNTGCNVKHNTAYHAGCGARRDASYGVRPNTAYSTAYHSGRSIERVAGLGALRRLEHVEE